MKGIKKNEQGSYQDEVLDDSNPQQGGISYPRNSSGCRASGGRAKMSRRDVSRVKNPRKIFVGGLPGTVNDQEFREFFRQFGTVMDSAVIFDSNTRRSRGFGFVTFKEESVAQGLLGGGNGKQQIGSVVIRGKMCEVKPAEPKVDSSSRAQHEEAFSAAPSDPYYAPQPPHSPFADFVTLEPYFPYQQPSHMPHESCPPMPPVLMHPLSYPMPYSLPHPPVMYTNAAFSHPQPFYPIANHPYEHPPMHAMLHCAILTDDSDSTNPDNSQHANHSHDVHDHIAAAPDPLSSTSTDT